MICWKEEDVSSFSWVSEHSRTQLLPYAAFIPSVSKRQPARRAELRFSKSSFISTSCPLSTCPSVRPSVHQDMRLGPLGPRRTYYCTARVARILAQRHRTVLFFFFLKPRWVRDRDRTLHANALRARGPWSRYSMKGLASPVILSLAF